MIRNIIRNKTILAVLSIVAGIYLIISGWRTPVMIVRFLGYGLIAAAVVYLLSYFAGPARDQTKLGYALLTGVCGALVVSLAGTIVNMIPMLLGLVLVVNAVSNLVQSLRNPVAPAAEKILPCLVALAGLWVLFHPGAILNTAMTVAGVTLIINGLADLNLIRRFWRA